MDLETGRKRGFEVDGVDGEDDRDYWRFRLDCMTVEAVMELLHVCALVTCGVCL